MKKDYNLKKIILGTLFVIFVIGAVYYIVKLDIGIDDIKSYVDSFGKLSPLIYTLIFAIVPILPFPDSILAISGGLIFGLIKGYIFTTIGALLGSTLAFYISRYFGRNLVMKLTNEKLDNIEKMINERGFILVLLLRLIPLFPFDVINYGAGLTSIKYKDYILATLIGTIPGILVFTNLGAKSVDIGSSSFYMAIVALILLVIVSIFLKKRFLPIEMQEEEN